MFTINEKRHIKNFFHIINFLNSIQKNWNQKKKQILLQLNQQTIQFIHKTYFFTNQQKKNLPLLLKETRHKNLTKKQRKKNCDCISSKHWKKIIKWIKKKTSNQTRHLHIGSTTLPQEQKQPRARKKLNQQQNNLIKGLIKNNFLQSNKTSFNSH